MEFGRTPGQIRTVLAVLGDGGDSIGQVLAVAVALAEAEHARLTLVKTCPGGRAYVWIAPFAAGGAYLPPPVESPEEAARILARAAEEVPGCLPVTMRVLGCDTQRSLMKLLHDSDFGAVVLEQALLSHCRRLRRQLRQQRLIAIPVLACERGDAAKTAGPSMSSKVTEDGALDSHQVSQGGRGRRNRLRPAAR